MELLKKLIVPICILFAGVIVAFITKLWIMVLLSLSFSLFLASATIRQVIATRAQNTETPRVEILPPRPSFDLHKIPYEVLGEFQKILDKKKQIIEVIQTLSDSSVLQPEQITDQVETLVETYYDLTMTARKIEPFIPSGVLRQLNVEIDNLEEELKISDDEIMKQNLQMALENKKGEKEKVVEFQRNKKRISAQLLNISTALENIYVRLVHFSLTPQDFDHVTQQQITDQIGALIEGLQSSENLTAEIDLAINGQRLHQVV